ncbi:alpha/beta fold hydrolase [Aequorivita flava]|uniref:Alpha/beta hydrolase n=1 Tax=Aequorivita flava TaxID=3114371 RepID=A0AB35YUI7_9FLAO
MTFNFKNTRIHYEVFGEGPAVVLLHGFLESSTTWKPLISQLSEHNTVITLDFPGHGNSGVLAQSFTMEIMATVIAQLLLRLNISTATFIGHSMGGYIALAYAELFSENIEKLVLLNSSPAADSEARKNNRNRALKVIDKSPKAYISMAISNLIAETSREKYSAEINQLKAEAYTFPVEGIKAAIKGMRDRKDRTEVLKNFGKEKHVLLAADDPILPVLEVKELAENCNATVKVIAGGHMSLIENKDSVAKYLKQLL